MTLEDILKEFQKGCSCAQDKPSDCKECLNAAVRAIKHWHGKEGGLAMTDIIHHDFTPPSPPDPWRHAQPSLRDMGDREELWSHPYFGVSHLIWATGSHTTPEPPSPPTGGTPAAANVGRYDRLRVAA